MRNGKSMLGKPIVTYDSGEKYKTITDLIFDQENNLLLGFLVDEAGWFSNALVLPLSNIQVIGNDGIIVASKEAITAASKFPQMQKILTRDNILKGTRIMTTDGRDLGTMEDLYFDDISGAIEGYEVSGGIFADAYSGRSFVPAPDTLRIGEDVAFVPAHTADLMEEQIGGIKAVLQTAGGKIQEMAQATGEKAQEVTQLANTKLTNIIISPEEQEIFILGRVTQQAVENPNGGYLIQLGQIVNQADILLARQYNVTDELYRATGGSVKNKIGENLTGAVANISIEQAQGRRVRQTIFTHEGLVVAAAGQIVTPRVIERAKIYHQEPALLESVGLKTGEALKNTSSDVGQQMKDGAKGLWEQVKETASNLQDQGTQVIEDKRIKGALGRPVTRVILDRRDEVILNVGELITHQAIADSRQADVLEILLDSVYTETPQLFVNELRAPEPGKAALSQ